MRLPSTAIGIVGIALFIGVIGGYSYWTNHTGAVQRAEEAENVSTLLIADVDHLRETRDALAENERRLEAALTESDEKRGLLEAWLPRLGDPDDLFVTLEFAESEGFTLMEWIYTIEGELLLAYEEKDAIGRQLQESRNSYRQLIGERDRLLHEHDALQDEVKLWKHTSERASAEVARLKGAEDELRQEVMLAANPLPVAYLRNSTYTGWLLCTGSMEPAMTCLDRVTWLKDVAAEDITVGTVIAFRSDCGGRDIWAAHRVIAVKVEDGTHYYRPKADIAPAGSDDGCWVPQDDIIAYAILVEKNIYPRNAYLRDQVQAAKAAFDAAVQGDYGQRGAAKARYDCWLDVARRSTAIGQVVPNQCGQSN